MAPIKPNDKRGIDPQPNRAYERRRDDDTFKTPAINIYDIDYAIMYWLQNRLDLNVVDNESMVKVPVIYGSGEKWAQVQSNGFLRDDSGKLMVPLCVLHRTSIRANDNISQLDVEFDPSTRLNSNRLIIVPNRNSAAKHDHFSKVYNAKPEKEYYLMAIPSFVLVDYEVILWTDYVEQMNSLVQEIEPTDGYAWGDTWKFVTRINGYDFEVVTGDNDDRMVKCTITLTTNGILLNEFELRTSQIEKAYTLKRVNFNNERSHFAAYVDNLPEDMYPEDEMLRRDVMNMYNSIIK